MLIAAIVLTGLIFNCGNQPEQNPYIIKLKTDTIKIDTTKADTVKKDTTKPSTTITITQKRLTIYFIRHAETIGNISDSLGGSEFIEAMDSFTPLGLRQVSELTNYLVKENIVPDHIIVSPTKRTQKTIEPFLVAKDLTAEIWMELAELYSMEPSGEPLPTEPSISTWQKAKIVAANTVFRSEQDIYYWITQSYEQGLFMAMTARDRFLDQYSQSGKTIMIVGHYGNGSVFLGLLQGYDMLTSKPQRPIWLMNTGVQLLSQDTLSGAFTLIKQNINNPPLSITGITGIIHQ